KPDRFAYALTARTAQCDPDLRRLSEVLNFQVCLITQWRRRNGANFEGGNADVIRGFENRNLPHERWRVVNRYAVGHKVDLRVAAIDFGKLGIRCLWSNLIDEPPAFVAVRRESRTRSAGRIDSPEFGRRAATVQESLGFFYSALPPGFSLAGLRVHRRGR